MTFAWHHPSYYRKLKQNSRGSRKLSVPSMNDVSEVLLNSPPTMETEVEEVSRPCTAHTSTKEEENE
jgi:hypothetical protein